MLEAVYKKRCLRCHGDISSLNLERGEFCKRCMEEIAQRNDCENMLFFEHFCEADKKCLEFKSFFKEKTGHTLSSVQKMWAKRFFLGSSFALLAPTGIGKTTFGLLLSAFVKNSYIVFPTKMLVLEALKRFEEWNINVLAYTGKKKEKEKIAKGEYNILITTTQFLYKNSSLIRKDFELVFVDDVDSLLKSGRKIEDVLRLLGFCEGDLQKALEYIRKKEYEKIEKIALKKKGNLIVSSATANPRSKRILLFLFLLGFEVSRPNLALRNIEDLYDGDYSWEKSVEWIKTLGKGGLLFLPGNETKEKLFEYLEFLKKNGIKAYSYEEFEKHLDEFKKGECYFVGFASYKNPLARGIDLPEHIRYTLFVGVPKMEFSLKSGNFKSLYFVMLSVLPFLSKKNLLNEEELYKIQKNLEFMKKYIFFTTLHPKVEEKLEKTAKEMEELIKKFENEIKTSPEISFDGERIVTADVTGYIQASGRCSRFYKGHLTKGVSLVLVDNEKAFFSLQKKLRWFSEIEFKNIKDADIQKILEEVDKSRKSTEKMDLKTSFVIVESPTKAKTLSSFFGKPSKRIISGVAVYEVMAPKRTLLIAASVGHDFDLSDEGLWGVLNKYIPVFEVMENKEKILNAFNITSDEVDEVLIATDPDREGEKIAFDLYLNNRILNENIKRIEFHEITKTAFNAALNSPRSVDLNLVASQFVRRITDRWVGFKLSAYLQDLLKNPHLSAGRVQTPVLRWICERTKRLKEKIYVVRVEFDGVKVDFELEKNAREFFESIQESVEVIKVSEKTEELFEKPFNTSALLKEASLKLGFSPSKTMLMAQELFEKGFITYHRTDSHRISAFGMSVAKEYITERFGSEYLKLEAFEKGGAHEAIRATFSMDADDLRSFAFSKGIELTSSHFKLYDLIFRKFIASQMRETEVLKKRFKILTKEEEFITDILQDGFNLIYPIRVVKITEGKKKIKKEMFKRPKYLPFTYADVIGMMKEKGIGRPSTYALSVEKLLKRKYVVEKKGFLFATRLGFKVIGILDSSEYKEFVKEEFSADLERIMDEIEEGKRDYKKELISFFSLLF